MSDSICSCGLDIDKLSPIHRFIHDDEYICAWCLEKRVDWYRVDPEFVRPEPGQEVESREAVNKSFEDFKDSDP